MSDDELERLLNSAQQCVRQHEWTEALGILEQATHLDVKCTSAWYEKGKILNRLGRFGEALEAFETVVNIDPEDSDGWYNKGVILTKLGRIEESLEAYHEASRLNPESSDGAKLEGIDFLGILGRNQSALEGLERVASNEQSGSYTNERFMYRIGLAFVWDDGTEDILVIEDIDPSNVEVKSMKYPQYSFTIESRERVQCNYPAKELAGDLAAEIVSDEGEIGFYVFPNGQIPAYTIRIRDEIICDIVVTDRFMYQLKRKSSGDDEKGRHFAGQILALFRPFQND